MLSILGAKDCTTASGDYDAWSGSQFVKDGCLEIPKRRLADLLEVHPNGCAKASFDHRVGVKERPTKALR